MKDHKTKYLTEKYEAGESSLAEERQLFVDAKGTSSPLETWSTFVQKNKKTAPEEFNDKMWLLFEKRKKRKLFLTALSAAASILLIMIAIFMTKEPQTSLSYDEKQALLEEGLAMFTTVNQDQSQEEVLFENEFIIIYTSNK